MTLKVGVIGSGRAGIIHAKSYLSHVEGAKLVGMSDPDKDVRAKVSAELGVPVYETHGELLGQGLDAVAVVTPTGFHHDIVLEAAAAGVHIFCEKPMGMTVAECEDMIAATDAAGVKLQIGFMRRFDVGHRRAKELLDQGAIGDVVSVMALTHGPSIPHPWMYDLKISGGPLAEVSSHDVDIMRWFTGSDVVAIHAFAGNYRCGDAREQFPDFYDSFVLNARFASGAMGQINGAQGVRYGYDSRLEIHGTNGRIDVGSLAGNRVVVHGSDGTSTRDIVPSWRNLYHDAYIEEARAFVKAIRDDTETEVTGRDGLEAVRIVTVGNTAIATGEIQHLN